MYVAFPKTEINNCSLSTNKNFIQLYEIREKQIQRCENYMNNAIRWEKHRIADRLKVLGTPIEHIAQATGLPEQQIRDL